MPVKNKYLLLLLLVVLMLLPVLMLSGLQTAQYLLKHSATERFAAKQLHSLTVNEADVKWEEKDRELRIGNQFFDVVSVQRTNGKLLLKGYFDEAETEVWLLLQHALGHKTPIFISRFLLLLQCLYPAALLLFLFTVQQQRALRRPRFIFNLPFALHKAPFTPPRFTSTFY